MNVKTDRVYVIGAAGHPDRVKIGHAIDPLQRLWTDLQPGSPVELYLMWTWAPPEGKTAQACEAVLHQVLSGYRIHNEWFRMRDSDPLCLVRRAWRDFVSDEHGTWYDGLWRYGNRRKMQQRDRCVVERTVPVCPGSGEPCVSQESLCSVPAAVRTASSSSEHDGFRDLV
ncbi:GIY-YIG nuclease family protein [Streptomyces anthocyanicus]|uniref:GIY-YIG nuclease family protein n=1 Tax=Streptomyces anthocyanicus TaxID=68174 RepID=UPI0038B45050